MTDAADWDVVGAACEAALHGTLTRYRMRRVVPGLTGEYDVAWANEVAFLSVVVEPRDPFYVYVGRLVDGRLPDYLGGPDGQRDLLDVDFFIQDAGVELPPRPPMAPRLSELTEALKGYDSVLPAAVGRVLDGDLGYFDVVVDEALTRGDDDD